MTKYVSNIAVATIGVVLLGLVVILAIRSHVATELSGPAAPVYYPMVEACNAAGWCARAEDAYEPYGDVPTCEARLATIVEQSADSLTELLGGGLTYRTWCGTLENLRRAVPGAYKRLGGVAVNTQYRGEYAI